MCIGSSGDLSTPYSTEVVSSPEFISCFSGAIIDNFSFISPMGALLRFKQRKLVTEQDKIEGTCYQFVKTWTTIDPRPVLVASKKSDRPPTDIYNNKTSTQAYSIQQWKFDYRNEWDDSRPSQVTPVHKSSQPYRNKSAPPYIKKIRQMFSA